MADYYAAHAGGDNPFNWIRHHPLMDQAISEQYDFDHAGIGETSLLMALEPAGVDMSRLSTAKWYLANASEATVEHGQRAVGLVLERMRRVLRQG